MANKLEKNAPRPAPDRAIDARQPGPGPAPRSDAELAKVVGGVGQAMLTGRSGQAQTHDGRQVRAEGVIIN